MGVAAAKTVSFTTTLGWRLVHWRRAATDPFTPIGSQRLPFNSDLLSTALSLWQRAGNGPLTLNA